MQLSHLHLLQPPRQPPPDPVPALQVHHARVLRISPDQSQCGVLMRRCLMQQGGLHPAGMVRGDARAPRRDGWVGLEDLWGMVKGWSRVRGALSSLARVWMPQGNMSELGTSEDQCRVWYG